MHQNICMPRLEKQAVKVDLIGIARYPDVGLRLPQAPLPVCLHRLPST